MPTRPGQELQRLLREGREELERTGGREDWRQFLDSLGLTLPANAVQELQRAYNRITLSGDSHGGFHLGVANGIVKGLAAGSAVTRIVTVSADTIIDGVEFIADPAAISNPLVTIQNGAVVLFRNCTFRGSSDMKAAFIKVVSGSALFTGCLALGATQSDVLIDNQVDTVMTVAWLNSINMTGTVLGEVVDAISPAWAGGAASPKVLTHTTAGVLNLSTLHEVVLCYTAAGPMTLQLPSVADYFGYKFTVKKADASANNITLLRGGTDSVEGGASIVWNTQYETHTVVSDGIASWWELND